MKGKYIKTKGDCKANGVRIMKSATPASGHDVCTIPLLIQIERSDGRKLFLFCDLFHIDKFFPLFIFRGVWDFVGCISKP